MAIAREITNLDGMCVPTNMAIRWLPIFVIIKRILTEKKEVQMQYPIPFMVRSK